LPESLTSISRRLSAAKNITFIGNEGNWKWAHDNEVLLPESSSFWSPGRPNNKTPNRDDCVVMVLGGRTNSNNATTPQHDFSWEDTSCLVPTIQRQFDVAPICQRDIGDSSVVSTVSKVSKCMAGWAEFQGHCYLPKTTRLNWNEAEADCKRYPGGHLASIHSEAENDFVNKFISGNFWIGGQGGYSPFYWSDGRPWRYTKGVLSSSPYNNAYCVYADANANWDYSGCHEARPYICKKNALDVN
jgi:hypothetical protein